MRFRLALLVSCAVRLEKLPATYLKGSDTKFFWRFCAVIILVRHAERDPSLAVLELVAHLLHFF
jgi:hypothetical protein